MHLYDCQKDSIGLRGKMQEFTLVNYEIITQKCDRSCWAVALFTRVQDIQLNVRMPPRTVISLAQEDVEAVLAAGKGHAIVGSSGTNGAIKKSLRKAGQHETTTNEKKNPNDPRKRLSDRKAKKLFTSHLDVEHARRLCCGLGKLVPRGWLAWLAGKLSSITRDVG